VLISGWLSFLESITNDSSPLEGAGGGVSKLSGTRVWQENTLPKLLCSGWSQILNFKATV